MDLNESVISMESIKFLSLQRKWNRLPRFFRLYLIVILAFVALTFSLYIFIFSKKSINENLVSKLIFVKKHNSTELEFHIEENAITTIESHLITTRTKIDNGESYTRKTKYLTMENFKIASSKQNEQQALIQKAILHSWQGYQKYAWGKDFLKPLTKKGHDWYGIGITILDSLDTLIIAGLENEFKEALKWIKNDLTFEVNEYVNCFETTIRALAGLLSAYHLSKETVLLDKAIDLGNRMIHCFDSPSGKVPYSDVNLKTKIAKAPSWSSESSLSEASSVQLEFRDLSYESNDKTFEEKSFLTSKHIHEQIQHRKNYLLPMYINPFSGDLVPSAITLGARADSYYEYLYKQYAQTKIGFLLEDYIQSIALIKKQMMKTTIGNLKLTYIGEILPNEPHSIHPKMDHLVCFLSGTLAFGYYHEHKKNDVFNEHLKMAKDLARTCHYTYNLTETGLAPEIAYFGVLENESEFYIKPRDTHNLLRPEFVESLFFLYHITGDQMYRDWGMQVFNAFQKYTKVNSGGYTTIDDVRHPNNVKPKDMMESFWLAETLKYLYLLFLDDKTIIDLLLNSYIFNTEGHLLPIRVRASGN